MTHRPYDWRALAKLLLMAAMIAGALFCSTLVVVACVEGVCE